jgi:hypothetical protein
MEVMFSGRMLAGMRTINAAVIFLAIVVAAPAAAPGFWQQLTPGQRRAAGVEQLTPEQQQVLDSLAELYAGNAARQVREQARQEVRDEVRRELTAENKTKAADDRAVIRTRIAGKTDGWSGATVFRLENGQVWVQTDRGDSYWMPTAENPEVELRPASLGGWKLFFTGQDTWVRVRRVR